jgi:hypothetical protein
MEGGPTPSGAFFDQPTVSALRDALDRVEAEPGRFDARRIREQAEHFGPERFERELLREIDALLEPRRIRPKAPLAPSPAT